MPKVYCPDCGAKDLRYGEQFTDEKGELACPVCEIDETCCPWCEGALMKRPTDKRAEKIVCTGCGWTHEVEYRKSRRR